jgi:hypothetical protein
MPTIYSNVVTISVNSTQVSYSLSLSFSNTSFSSSGGTATATAKLSANVSGVNLSGYNVTLNQLASASTSATVINSWQAVTDSNGYATFTVSIPANNSTSTAYYYFDAVATV